MKDPQIARRNLYVRVAASPGFSGAARAKRARRRARHGRNLGLPLLRPNHPGWNTRSAQFDQVAVEIFRELCQHQPKLGQVELAVEAVPASDPAPWEDATCLARFFPAEHKAGLHARIVLYQRPIRSQCISPEQLQEVLYIVLLEQCAQALGGLPQDLAPDY